METPGSHASTAPCRVYTGCRTSAARGGRGTGIETYDALGDGRLRPLRHRNAAPNPSFLCLDRQAEHLYAVHGDGATASAFRIHQDGRPEPIGERACGGRNPVHLLISRSGRWLLISNFASGNLASLPILADGSLGEVACSLPLPGEPGPHRTQQLCSHPHQLVYHPVADWIAVPDKGVDAIHIVRLNEETGALEWCRSTGVAAGGGPRHLVFSRDGLFAWIVLELSSQVLAAQVCAASGTFAPFARMSTLPSDYTGDNTASGIVLTPEEDRLYVSNRGHGSVVQFAVQSRHLDQAVWHRTAGKVPRFVSLSPDRQALWVANEDADVIERLSATGEATAIAHTGSPVCIVFPTGVQE